MCIRAYPAKVATKICLEGVGDRGWGGEREGRGAESVRGGETLPQLFWIKEFLGKVLSSRRGRGDWSKFGVTLYDAHLFIVTIIHEYTVLGRYFHLLLLTLIFE